MYDLRKPLIDRGYSVEAANLYLKSWRENTHTSYKLYIDKWLKFLLSENITNPTEVHVCNFLANLAQEGFSYSTINTARSAISAYLEKDEIFSMGSNKTVCRILKGVFTDKPPLPKYVETWDVDTVLEVLKHWPCLDKIDLKKLTLRTVMLLAIVSGQRGQSIHKLHVEDIHFVKDKCIISYSSLLKHSRIGTHLAPMEFERFEDPNLCIVSHLKKYINVTANLRQDNRLLVSFQKPHKFISRDTLSRWIKIVLEMCGIDNFSSHSTRAASVTAAFNRNVCVDSILNAAGWSNESTFKKFYLKPVKKTKSFSQAVLDSFLNKD